MHRSLLRPVASILCALGLAIAAPDALAQTRNSSPSAPSGSAESPAPRPSRIGRLAAASRQGASDEVVLPVTEVRARRAAAAERREARPRAVRLCLKDPVEIRRLRSRDAPRWVGSLTDCNGRPTLRAMAALALLAQPMRAFAMNLPAAMNELRRVAPAAGLHLVDDVAPPRARTRRGAQPPAQARVEVPRDPRTHDPIVEVSRGARALHPRLLQLVQAVVEHFPGRPIEIVSGYRPGEGASRHSHARALDLRVVGVRHEELRDFARTLPDAGVGFYPNSVFIHLDVRDSDEGRAFWTDYSGPGETPRYGHWPPTDQDVQSEVGWMVHSNGGRLTNELQREWNGDAQHPAAAHDHDHDATRDHDATHDHGATNDASNERESAGDDEPASERDQ